MLGAIAGDVIGSVYEWDRIKSCDFPLFDPRCYFTDDSVLTVATSATSFNAGSPTTWSGRSRTSGPHYSFDETCQRTVPEAIVAFLESTDVEDAIRLAVSLGGDSDTLAAITGGIAHAYYGDVPGEIADPVLARLTPDLLAVVQEVERRYPLARGGMLPSS